MRAATALTTALILGASIWLGAQTARPATTPEVFTGTAQAKNAASAVSGTLELRISRYMPDFDRKTLEDALKFGGYPKFVIALRNAPEFGQLTLAGGQPFAIRYAREKVDGTGRTIVVVTDRPVFFVGSQRADAKPKAGFELGIVQIQVDAAGKGRGTMAAAARVRPDGDGGVLLDDYADALIEVTNVTRRAGSQ